MGKLRLSIKYKISEVVVVILGFDFVGCGLTSITGLGGMDFGLWSGC